MLEKLWDDVVAGPQPYRGLEKLRKATKPLVIDNKDAVGESSSQAIKSSPSMPSTPMTPATPMSPATPTTPSGRPKHNVWRSVFNPGSNLAMKNAGADMFDKPQPNSPSIYDWLYSGETKSPHM